MYKQSQRHQGCVKQSEIKKPKYHWNLTVKISKTETLLLFFNLFKLYLQLLNAWTYYSTYNSRR